MQNIELLAFREILEPGIKKIPYVKNFSIDIEDDKIIFNLTIDENVYVVYKLINPISVEEIIEKWISRPYLPKEFNIKYE